MKASFIATALLIGGLALGTTSCSKQETELQPGPQTTCPVMKDRPIDRNMYVDVDGKRIYACCPGCIGQIKANPDKYITDMEAAGVVLEDTPK